MEPHCLPFSEIPHTSKLFFTFLDDFSGVSRFYPHPPTAAGLDAVARAAQLDPGVRRFVVDILREQNCAFGPNSELDPATSRNLDRLSSGAVAIVTGQQVGLFSGPAYTFYKALTAIRCAEDATRRGIDAVPVFWLASEDHDLAEINHSSWCTRGGFARYELPLPAEKAGHRVGEIVLGDSIQSILSSAAGTLDGPFASEITRALHESYAPTDTYASAFGRLMARTLAGRGLILLDQLDSRLHQLYAPVFARAIRKSGDLREALLSRSKELEGSGFHAQVKITSETTLLFSSMAGSREPIRAKNGDFALGHQEISASDFTKDLEAQPQAFSPNALLRPVIQDSILPTAAYIAGAAEIAYMAQAQVVYQTLGVRMPAILPRASFTLIETPIARFLAQYDAGLGDVLAGRQHLRAKMEQKSLPGALASRFDQGEEELRRIIRNLKEPLAQLDSTLVESLSGAEAKMLHQLVQLKGKVARAENFRSGVLDRHERILIDSLTPHGELQERTLCFLPFLAEHGPSLLDELIARSSVTASTEDKSWATQHQVLVL
jgi:bacillithiol biosynthesis cysteine-adding enzyme BshC